MAGEHVELPEELIQHIQSFLHPDQAARTSVLSKLWYSAWSTRPILCLDGYNFHRARTTRLRTTTTFLDFARTNLGFDEKNIPKPRTETWFTDFQNFSRRSINRYQKHKLKLNTFKLSMFWRHGGDAGYNETTRLADELILSALSLGVNDLDTAISGYTLPHQVFSSIYLKKLYMHRGNIDLPQSNGKFKVLCSRLVSLKLYRVRVTDDMMRDILLGCPLIEDLRVDRCYDLEKINLNALLNLKTLSVCRFYISSDDNSDFFLDEPERLLVEWEENIVLGTRVNGHHHQCHNLISLKLSYVELDDLFFKFFSHRFPCVERLELEECSSHVNINIDIVSDTLRYLSLIRMVDLTFANIQVPNIQNFSFESTELVADNLSLSFLTASMEWKSDLVFYQPCEEDGVWLFKITDIRILTELGMCKISLSINLNADPEYEVDIPSTPTSPLVENLEIQTWRYVRPIRSRFLLNWLFCCRPKYITWIDQETLSYEALADAYNELKKHENKILSDTLPCIHGLEEVEMEYYEETLREWCTVPRVAKKPAHGKGQFRLRLKWA